mmetsp:Transcript_6322/g.25603  ORF Transcript_6322/g.25603 Transcript_6322/m.25603 type:complete len:200 (-) Transcript_6322:65-664(-)
MKPSPPRCVWASRTRTRAASAAARSWWCIRTTAPPRCWSSASAPQTPRRETCSRTSRTSRLATGPPLLWKTRRARARARSGARRRLCPRSCTACVWRGNGTAFCPGAAWWSPRRRSRTGSRSDRSSRAPSPRTPTRCVGSRRRRRCSYTPTAHLCARATSVATKRWHARCGASRARAHRFCAPARSRRLWRATFGTRAG